MGLFDAIGDIFGTSNATSVNIPGRSPEETRLLGLQADSLTRQSKLQDLLMPYQLRQLGLTPSFDASGAISGVTEGPQAKAMRDLQDRYSQFASTQLEGQMKAAPGAAEIQQRFQDRTLAALKGELPVNPALTRSLTEGERDLRNSLRQQIGTGYETSSPGIESLDRFNTSKNILLENARRGDITTAETMGLARGASNTGSGISSSDLSSRLRGLSLQEMLGLPSGYAGANAGINSFLGREGGFRMDTGKMNLQSNMFNAQQTADVFGELLGTGARMSGMGGYGAPTSLFGKP
jgi:hypothetical protein